MKREETAHSEENSDSMYVSHMAEYISPPITLITPDGKHHTVRKFLWMGHWGFTDAKGSKVIVPAKSTYLQLYILIRAQLLVAGCYSTGWDVFTLEGKKINSYPPMSISELQEQVEKG